VAANAEKIPALFPKGTEAGVAGSKTKPELWEQPDRFTRLSNEYKQATQTLLAAARAGDADRVKASFGGVTGGCNACHDAYQIR
jgi:cytochrome c556